MHYEELVRFLEEHGVRPSLLKDVDHFRKTYKAEEVDRIPSPIYKYYGVEVWEKAITALLEGHHILLSGPKATGKNVLTENLSLLFGRPQYNISMNVTSDAQGLIGADTFRGGEVTLRPGPVTAAALSGGFAVLDEINMAKNEAMSVIHSALDYRRIIDVPGYDLIHLHEACRFIGTMNYGYIGTRELNEALVSRFLLIHMHTMSPKDFHAILRDKTHLTEEAIEGLSRLFLDLQEKSLYGEISSKAIDMRGLLGAVSLMERGLGIYPALAMGMVDKCFDDYEKSLVEDVIRSLIPEDTESRDFFYDR